MIKLLLPLLFISLAARAEFKAGAYAQDISPMGQGRTSLRAGLLRVR